MYIKRMFRLLAIFQDETVSMHEAMSMHHFLSSYVHCLKLFKPYHGAALLMHVFHGVCIATSTCMPFLKHFC